MSPTQSTSPYDPWQNFLCFYTNTWLFWVQLKQNVNFLYKCLKLIYIDIRNALCCSMPANFWVSLCLTTLNWLILSLKSLLIDDRKYFQERTLRMPITAVTSFSPTNSFKISSPESASIDSPNSFGNLLSFEAWKEGFVSVPSVKQEICQLIR